MSPLATSAAWPGWLWMRPSGSGCSKSSNSRYSHRRHHPGWPEGPLARPLVRDAPGGGVSAPGTHACCCSAAAWAVVAAGLRGAETLLAGMVRQTALREVGLPAVAITPSYLRLAPRRPARRLRDRPSGIITGARLRAWPPPSTISTACRKSCSRWPSRWWPSIWRWRRRGRTRSDLRGGSPRHFQRLDLAGGDCCPPSARRWRASAISVDFLLRSSAISQVSAGKLDAVHARIRLATGGPRRRPRLRPSQRTPASTPPTRSWSVRSRTGRRCVWRKARVQFPGLDPAVLGIPDLLRSILAQRHAPPSTSRSSGFSHTSGWVLVSSQYW